MTRDLIPHCDITYSIKVENNTEKGYPALYTLKVSYIQHKQDKRSFAHLNNYLSDLKDTIKFYVRFANYKQLLEWLAKNDAFLFDSLHKLSREELLEGTLKANLAKIGFVTDIALIENYTDFYKAIEIDRDYYNFDKYIRNLAAKLNKDK